tara:strand:+ start:302 stop:472 length:171 start_codon:yes stop_codon:yes gene_type:complete
MGWKYVGDDGRFIPGIPARDLTDKEVKELGVQEVVEASDLWRKESTGRAKKPEGDN